MTATQLQVDKTQLQHALDEAQAATAVLQQQLQAGYVSYL